MDPNERRNELTGKSQLVRLYEANCAIDFPTDSDLRFRDALANKLTLELGLVVPKQVPTRTPIAGRA